MLFDKILRWVDMSTENIKEMYVRSCLSLTFVVTHIYPCMPNF
jgi:hypothetical protein